MSGTSGNSPYWQKYVTTPRAPLDRVLHKTEYDFQNLRKKLAVADRQRIWRVSPSKTVTAEVVKTTSAKAVPIKRKGGKSAITVVHKMMDGILNLFLLITKQSIKNDNSLSDQTKKYLSISNLCEAHQQVFYYHRNLRKLFPRVFWNFIISTSLSLRGFLHFTCLPRQRYL